QSHISTCQHCAAGGIPHHFWFYDAAERAALCPERLGRAAVYSAAFFLSLLWFWLGKASLRTGAARLEPLFCLWPVSGSCPGHYAGLALSPFCPALFCAL